MKFSIIVPVYNVEKYISKCITSIISQTFEDFELILVDDGSADKSGILCAEMAEHDKRIRVIHQENSGPAVARNTGIKAATGEWIMFVDSDDYIAENALKTLETVMNNHPADMYSYNLVKVDDNGKTIEKLFYAVENIFIPIGNEETKFTYLNTQILNYKAGWEVCTRVFRRDIIDKYNILFNDGRKAFAEDLEFTSRYILHAGSVYTICNILYHYRQLSSSLVHSYDERKVISRINELSCSLYAAVRAAGYKKMCRDFYQLYFTCMNFHIQYKVDSLSIDEILGEIANNKQCMKFLKKARKNRNLLQLGPFRYWI